MYDWWPYSGDRGVRLVWQPAGMEYNNQSQAPLGRSRPAPRPATATESSSCRPAVGCLVSTGVGTGPADTAAVKLLVRHSGTAWPIIWQTGCPVQDVHIISTFVNVKWTKTSRKMHTLWPLNSQENYKFDATRFQILRLKCTKFDFVKVTKERGK